MNRVFFTIKGNQNVQDYRCSVRFPVRYRRFRCSSFGIGFGFGHGFGSCRSIGIGFGIGS